MTATTKPDVRFIVHFERSTGTLSSGETLYTLSLEAVYLGPDRYATPPGEIRVRSPQFTAYGDDPVPELDSFTIHGQAEHGRDDSGWYGLGYDYRTPYRVDLPYAAAMAKTLRKVQRAIDRHTEKFGYAVAPETYCAVVARAVGATGERVFGIRDESTVDGYRWMGPDGLRSLLADTLAGKRDDKINVSRWG